MTEVKTLELPEVPVRLAAMQNWWTAMQIRPREIVRWSRFQSDQFIEKEQARQLFEQSEPSAGIRRQSVLQHSYGLAVLFSYVFPLLVRHLSSAGQLNLDMGLLFMAFLVHDQGEPLTANGDVQRNVKENSDDVAEWNAFAKTLEAVPDNVSFFQRRAFLLQFCLKSDEDREQFPALARVALEDLKEKKRNEALVFQALELWDYLMYALEQAVELGNAKILYTIMKGDREKEGDWDEYLALCDQLPGYREELMTEEVQAWLEEFFQRYEEAHPEVVPTTQE